MTDSPLPSDQPKTPQSAAFALIRPVLFASGIIAMALGALLLAHWANPQLSAKQVEPPVASQIALPEPEPPPGLTATDLQGFQLRAPEPVPEVEPPSNDRYELTLRLEKGDTIDKMLDDIDVPAADRKQIDEKLQVLMKKRKLAVGEQISLVIQPVPDQPDSARVLSLSVRPQPEREYLVLREDDGSYRGEEKVHKVSTRIVRVEGERQGSLQQSGVAAGAPSAAMVEFIRALSYDVDFQRELKEGQKFTVLLEQLVTSDGKVMHPGRLLAGELRLMKRTVVVVRFRPQGGADGFYTPQGENVVRSFLRTPMDASRVTSRFGMRGHPILGYSAMHTGVDFAAQHGTPILAAGAGKVKMAGYNGGYGLYVRLTHTDQIGTGYGHMSRLGPGIKPGVSVRQGQVIGFVGSTGMSTGPHLHYEFYRGNQPVNPLTQKFALRAALAGKDLARFHGLTKEYLAQLKSAPHVGDVAPPAKPQTQTQAPAKPGAVPQLARGE